MSKKRVRAFHREYVVMEILLLPICLFGPARGSILFQNPMSHGVTRGDCVFNTVCGQDMYGDPNTFLAQAFGLSGEAEVTAASFIVSNFDPGNPISFDFRIYSVGTLGVPDVLIASGENLSFSYTDVPLIWTEYKVEFPTIPLDSGEYFFAIHADTVDRGHHLTSGKLNYGAGALYNGVWDPDRTAGFSFALTLFGTGGPGRDPNPSTYPPPPPPPPPPDPIPEPATWLLMVLGFGLIGGAVRRVQLREQRFGAPRA